MSFTITNSRDLHPGMMRFQKVANFGNCGLLTKSKNYDSKDPMALWSHISLRVRIYTILAALLFITFAGGVVMVWYTYRMEGLLTSVIAKNLAAFQAAAALETALVKQKGFVSYYFLDGDPDWLRQLGEYRQIFRERLKVAYSLAENERQKAALRSIEAGYTEYISTKNRVIDEIYKNWN